MKSATFRTPRMFCNNRGLKIQRLALILCMTARCGGLDRGARQRRRGCIEAVPVVGGSASSC